MLSLTTDEEELQIKEGMIHDLMAPVIEEVIKSSRYKILTFYNM